MNIRSKCLSLLLAALALSWAGLAPAAEPIRLGAQTPQTGALAKHGQEQIKGVRLAVEMWQKARGVPVELKVYDDESDPGKAVAAVEKLAGMDKVHGIVGGYGSNLVGPASEAAERYDTPYICGGAVDTKLTAKGFKNFFRLNYMPGYAAAQAGAIAGVMKAGKVGILYNSQSATSEIAEEVKAQLMAAGVAVPVFEKYEKGTTNYKPLLLKVRDAGCQVLVVQGYHSDFVGTLKDAKVLNLPISAYVGSWGIGTPEFIREMGPMAEYLYGTSVGEVGTAPPEGRAEEEAMLAAYQAKHHEPPSYIAVLCYLGAKYMLEAIHQGGGPTSAYHAQKTRDALRATDVIGPIGRVAFDHKGDPKHFTALLFQVQKGKLTVVYPANRVNGQIIYPMVPWGAK